MGFRGEPFAFDSPAAAVAGMLASLVQDSPSRPAESCPLTEARGRILAQRVTADRDSPAFDHSAMDGYAVRSDALTGAAGNPVPVAGESRIGCAPPPMPASPCVVRIATGAPLPGGADAIIRREDVTEHNEGSRVVAVTITPFAAGKLRPGDNIRRRAENAPAGAVLLEPGAVLNAAAIGTLAAVGVPRPRVYPLLRVALITTGEELVPVDAIPSAYQLRNSNSAATGAILSSRPWISLACAIHARDDGPAVVGELRTALEIADAVVVTGGVSMGHRDPVRAAVEACDATIVFHGLPQRPGKPMLGALVHRPGSPSVPIFGLPGNPISAMVTCECIVTPILAACAGATNLAAPPRIAIANPDRKSLDLWWHRLVRLNERGEAVLIDGQGSGDVIAGGRADGFIEVPPGSLVLGDGAATYPFFAWPT